VIGLDVEWAAQLHVRQSKRKYSSVLRPRVEGDDDDDDDDDGEDDDYDGDDGDGRVDNDSSKSRGDGASTGDGSGVGGSDRSSRSTSSTSSSTGSANSAAGGTIKRGTAQFKAGKKGQSRRRDRQGGGSKPTAATLQLASQHSVAVIDITTLSASVEGRASLVKHVGALLRDPSVTKLGFGVGQDLSVLARAIRNSGGVGGGGSVFSAEENAEEKKGGREDADFSSPNGASSSAATSTALDQAAASAAAAAAAAASGAASGTARIAISLKAVLSVNY